MSARLSPQRKTLALTIISFWLIATVVAFWWFQYKNLRPFDLQMSQQVEDQSLSENLQKLLSDTNNDASTRGYIVNFWRPDCACNRFNTTHIKALKDKYQQLGLKLVTVTPASPDYSRQQLQHMVKEKFATPAIIVSQSLFSGASRVPAIPSVAIVDNTGRLNYFGPYNEGAFCGLGGTRFVEKVAEQLIANQQPNIINTLSYGCYCSWA